MKRIVYILCFLCATFTLWAKPASPILRSLLQPDGTNFKAYIRGDEFLTWVETPNGYTLLKDAQGWHTYAIKDEKGLLVPSDVRYQERSLRNGSENAPPAALPKGLFFSPEQMPPRTKAPSKRVTGLSTPANTSLFDSNSIETPVSPKTRALFSSTTMPSTGDRKMLAIILKFKEDGYNTNIYTKEYLTDLLNDDPQGFRNFYKKVSYNQLNVVSTVYEYTCTEPMSLYVDSCKTQTLNIGYLILDILSELDSLQVDLTEFDSDKDSKLDAVALFHSGRSAQVTSDPRNSIGTHMLNLSLVDDEYLLKKRIGGVGVGSYCIQSQYIEATGDEKETIGSITHEFGHIIGAPDYYGTGTAQNDGNGYWDVMAMGCNNGNPEGKTPSHFNAYQKVQFGWMSFSDLTDAQDVLSMPALETTPIAYQIAYKDTDEMFVLENRQDGDLPGTGLLIYRIDHRLICDSIDKNNINVEGSKGVGSEIIKALSTPNVSSPKTPFKNNMDFTPATIPGMVGKFGYKANYPIYKIAETNEAISFSFLKDPTNVNLSEQKNSLKVWNNKGSVTLSGEGLTGKQIEVYNLSGSLITRIHATSNEITLSLSAGIYHIRVEDSAFSIVL